MIKMKEKKTEELKNKIFSEELFFEEGKNENNIKQYVKKIFDLGNSNVNLPKKMKMKMKIFFISFISNKVIDQICGEVKEEKGFKYKSIYDFYYNILTTYNKAIIGLKKIKKKILKEKENLNKNSALIAYISSSDDDIYIGKELEKEKD